MLAKLIGTLFAARQPAQDIVSLACAVGGFAASAIDDRASGGQLDVQVSLCNEDHFTVIQTIALPSINNRNDPSPIVKLFS